MTAKKKDRSARRVSKSAKTISEAMGLPPPRYSRDAGKPEEPPYKYAVTDEEIGACWLCLREPPAHFKRRPQTALAAEAIHVASEILRAAWVYDETVQKLKKSPPDEKPLRAELTQAIRSFWNHHDGRSDGARVVVDFLLSAVNDYSPIVIHWLAEKERAATNPIKFKAERGGFSQPTKTLELKWRQFAKQASVFLGRDVAGERARDAFFAACVAWPRKTRPGWVGKFRDFVRVVAPSSANDDSDENLRMRKKEMLRVKP